MNSAASEREHLLTLMRSALNALEQGDEASYRLQIETLTQWRSSPIFAAFDRLARELTRSLETLPIDARLGALAGQELPDARAAGLCSADDRRSHPSHPGSCRRKSCID